MDEQKRVDLCRAIVAHYRKARPGEHDWCYKRNELFGELRRELNGQFCPRCSYYPCQCGMTAVGIIEARKKPR